jgi:hypothetical protein
MKAALGQANCRESDLRGLASREPVGYAWNRFFSKALVAPSDIAQVLPKRVFSVLLPGSDPFGQKDRK